MWFGHFDQMNTFRDPRAGHLMTVCSYLTTSSECINPRFGSPISSSTPLLRFLFARIAPPLRISLTCRLPKKSSSATSVTEGRSGVWIEDVLFPPPSQAGGPSCHRFFFDFFVRWTVFSYRSSLLCLFWFFFRLALEQFD